MIEIFKTNVSDSGSAKYIVDQIHQRIKGSKANFDLEDSDSILRVENEIDFNIEEVSQLVSQIGFWSIAL
jgi:hypothetical protein